MAEAKQVRLDASKKAKRRAAWIWKNAKDAEPNNLYLLKKKIKPHGVRQYKGALIVPVEAKSGEIASIQFIAVDGSKRFLKGGEVAGGSFTIPGNDQQILTEGYATGSSIHEVTGATVRIAFNAGNLIKVAEPGWVISGDNDSWTHDRHGEPWNPGKHAALTAAWEHNCRVAIPEFQNTESKPTYFNDLDQLEGFNAVKEQISNALLPHEFLLKECEMDPGAAYRPEHIKGLTLLKERNKPVYMNLRARLKRVKVGLTELEKTYIKHKTKTASP